MKKTILIVAMALSIAACGTRTESAEALLNQQGYTDVEITGYDMFSCSEDDNFKTGFVATAPNGDRVSGTVCEGLMKGKTIRFD